MNCAFDFYPNQGDPGKRGRMGDAGADGNDVSSLLALRGESILTVYSFRC